jgi:hypothetical protein
MICSRLIKVTLAITFCAPIITAAFPVPQNTKKSSRIQQGECWTALTPSEKKAAEAALDFLAVIDAGKYDETWDHLSILYKNRTTRQGWIDYLTKSRTPLGAPKRRLLKGVHQTKSLNNMPDSDYVVLLFETEFPALQKFPFVIEFVTMESEQGEWRVADLH